MHPRRMSDKRFKESLFRLSDASMVDWSGLTWHEVFVIVVIVVIDSVVRGVVSMVVDVGRSSAAIRRFTDPSRCCS